MAESPNATAVTLFAHIAASSFAGQSALILYYLGVLLGLVVLYGQGDFSNVGFIYQAF